MKGMLARGALTTAILGLAATTQVGLAQPAASTQSTGSGAGRLIDEVVVSARRREESLQDVPMAISAFSADDLARHGVAEFKDIQYRTPGLFLRPVAGSPSSTVLSLRGQTQADSLLTTDSSVGVYVDGVYVPRQLGLKSALYDIEHVEVLKGPQGTLYGRNTTGGAVGLRTVRPDHDGVHGFLEGEYGRFDRINLGGAVNVPLVEDRLAMRAVVRRQQRDGYGRSTFLNRDLADNDEWLLRLAFDAVLSERVHLAVTGQYQDLDQSGAIHQLTFPGTLDLAAGQIPASAIAAGVELGELDPADLATAGPTFVPGVMAGFAFLESQLLGGPDGNLFTNTAGDREFVSFESHSLAATLTVELPWGELVSTTGYRKFENARTIDLDGTFLGLFRGELNSESEFISQELHLLGSAFEERLDWIVGAYYSNEEGDEQNPNFALNAINPNNPAASDGSIDNSSWALFGQGSYAVNERVNVTAGLRYTEETKKLTSRNFVGAGPNPICNLPDDPVARPDPNVCEARFSDTFSDWSWLLSVDYSFEHPTLLYARTSRGFRGGGQNLRGNTDITSFIAFEPEYATDYEVGIKTDLFDRRLRLNLAAYYTDYEDIQRSVIFPTPEGNVVTVLVNAAEATIRGLEFDALAQLGDHWSIEAGLALVDASYDEFIDVDPVTRGPRDRSNEDFNTPKWTSDLLLRYERDVQGNRLGMQVHGYWQSSVNYNPASRPPGAGRQGSYALYNARVDLHIPRWDLDLVLFGRNLTNKTYFVDKVDFTTSLGYIVGVVAEPRTWGLQVKKRFGSP